MPEINSIIYQLYDELIERIQEAIELCLEMENEEFEPLEFVGVQRVTIKQ